jgi:hypothetical protein
MNDTEKTIAKKLVELAIEQGYTVSVFDGEEYPVKRSRNVEVIINALGSTDHDTLTIRKPEQLAKDVPVGSIVLIWGNDRDLISDYTDNAGTNALVARTMMEFEQGAA